MRVGQSHIAKEGVPEAACAVPQPGGTRYSGTHRRPVLEAAEGSLARSVAFYGLHDAPGAAKPPQDERSLGSADLLRGDRGGCELQLAPSGDLSRPETAVEPARRPGARALAQWGGELVQLIASRAWRDASQEVAEDAAMRGPRVALRALVSGLREGVGALFDAAMLLVGELVGAGRDARGVRTRRALNDDERAALQSVYGSQLNLDVMRIEISPAMTIGLRAGGRVVGNTIYLTPNLVDDEGRVRPRSFDTFLHEAAHVYQYQTGGADYMHNAVFARIREGAGEVYDWRGPLEEGRPFNEINPEQQAELLTIISLHRREYPERPVAGLFRAGEHVAPDIGARGVNLDGAMAARLNVLGAELLRGTPLNDVRW